MNFEINEKIEEETGEYVNPQVFELKSLDIKDQRANIITSLESYLYGYKKDLIETKLIPRIQNNLLNGKLETPFMQIVQQASKKIQNSPILGFEFIIYRGLASTLVLVPGQVYQHAPFLFCSLHFSFASCFLQDTTNCYSNYILANATQSAYLPTMLKIRVPAGTHYFETKINFNYPHNEPRSEIILDRGTKLFIESVELQKQGFTEFNLVTAVVVI